MIRNLSKIVAVSALIAVLAGCGGGGGGSTPGAGGSGTTGTTTGSTTGTTGGGSSAWTGNYSGHWNDAGNAQQGTMTLSIDGSGNVQGTTQNTTKNTSGTINGTIDSTGMMVVTVTYPQGPLTEKGRIAQDTTDTAYSGNLNEYNGTIYLGQLTVTMTKS